MKIIHALIAPAGLALLTGWAAAAQAAPEPANPTPYYLAPFGSYLHPGGDTHGFDGGGAGLALGKIIDEHFNVEVRGFWQNYDNDLPCCGGDTDVYGGTIDAQYYFMRSAFSPYLVAGIGGMITELHTPYAHGSEGSFIFETGLGTTYRLLDNLLLRGDVRYRLNTLPEIVDNAGVLNDLVVNAGFVINLN